MLYLCRASVSTRGCCRRCALTKQAMDNDTPLTILLMARETGGGWGEGEGTGYKQKQANMNT